MRIFESYPPEDNAVVLERFLTCDTDTARQLAQTPYLFVD
jgi:hypothetical protein